MKHLIFITAILGLIFWNLSCTKDELKDDTTKKETVSAPFAILSPQHELELSKSFSSGRNGPLLPIFDRDKFLFKNYLQAQQQGYVNTQIPLNKDSVVNVPIIRNFDIPMVNIESEIHAAYWVNVNFVNPNMKLPGDYQNVLCYVRLTSQPDIIPSGVNLVPHAQNYLRYERSNRLMDYYDTDFKKWKKKFDYKITNHVVGYNDFLNSKQANSSVFNF